LFATDFSSTTELALPYLIAIASQPGARIYAVHVVHPAVYPLLPPSEWNKMAHDEEEFRNRRSYELEEKLQGVSHEFLFPVGDVWQNLAKIISDKNVDLLILGTHGRTGIGKVLMGSVAESIFRQAACPVLSVGPAVSSNAGHTTPVKLDRVLYATDFSPGSLSAAPYASYLAKEHRAELILVHSAQNADAEEMRCAYHTLRDVVPVGTALEYKPRYVVERGAPEDTILGVAARYCVDMIVLGVNGARWHVAATAHFAESVAYKVVTRAQCPVLTVRW
jgi:nucleotide-binding universal stress UspA family protein